jgi:thiol-disulfide isomerase/thioredoxin
MKKLILAIFILSSITANAQDPSFQEGLDAMNNFGRYSSGAKPNLDSALYCIRKVAVHPKLSSNSKSLLHEGFAQSFVPQEPDSSDTPERIEYIKISYRIRKEVLAKLATDSLKILSDAAKPILLLTQIQDNKDNVKQLKLLINKFIQKELTPQKFYTDKTGRYGLMIYQIISEKPELAALSKQLFTQIKTTLASNQITNSDTLSRKTQGKRAWYRYLYAFTNYTEAQTIKNPKQKEVLLKTAYEYSPDLADRNNGHGYSSEQFFLSGKKSYQLSYLDYLTENSTNKNQILDVHLAIALTNPQHKNRLRDYYTTNFPDRKSFSDFWLESIEAKAASAHPVALNLLDKTAFSDKKNEGKWIMLDFWGTWCHPCRAEHPDLQNFYDSTVLKKPENIALLTIACFDQEEKVVSYMKEKNLSFPVALSDNTIQKTYNVQGYPTKILITPNRKYVVVPFNIDWQGFIKNYCEI